MKLDLDHVVLEVRSVPRSVAFYEDVLGLKPVRLAEFLRGEVPFVSARLNAGSVLDFFPRRMWRGRGPENPNHVCLVTSKAALRSLEARLARRRIRITRRDDHNFGARGFGRSLYFDDPDGISIEVRCYA